MTKSTLKNAAKRPLKEYENAFKNLHMAKKNEKLGQDGIMLDPESGGQCGELHIKVVRCENLLPMDFNGSSDPYVTVTLIGDGDNEEVYGGPGMKEWQSANLAATSLVRDHPSTRTTKVVHDDLNPIFNEVLTIKPIVRKGGKLRVAVYDEDDVMNDEFIGQKTIDLKEFEKDMKNSTEAVGVKGFIPVSYDLENDTTDEADDDHGEYRGKIYLDLNLVYSRIDYYSKVVDSLQRNKDSIVNKVIDAEEELWSLISPFAVGSKELLLAHDNDGNNLDEEDDEQKMVDVDLSVDTNPLPSLGNLPTLYNIYKTPTPAKFFWCGFTAVSVLIVLLGIILNSGGENQFAKIYPGEP